MCAESSGMFTLKEINRVKIIQDVIERRMTTHRAAEHLGISDRQCHRLLVRYREEGPLGMANRRRGMRGNRQLMPGLADQALELIRTRYADFGPTLAQEKLAELHGLILGKETVRRIMTRAGLWVPRKQRAARIHQPRYRRPCTGELIQIDGCDHEWFEDRGPACTVDSIDQCNIHAKTWGSGGLMNETYIYGKGKRVCFRLMEERHRLQ